MQDVDEPALVAIPAQTSDKDITLRTAWGEEKTVSPLEYEYIKLSLHSLLGDDLKGDTSAGGRPGEPPLVLAMRELDAAAGELHALGNLLNMTRGIGSGRNPSGVQVPAMFDTVTIAARPPPPAWAAQTAARAHAVKVAALRSAGEQLVDDASRLRAASSSRRDGVSSLRALSDAGWRLMGADEANSAAASGHMLITRMLQAVRSHEDGSVVELPKDNKPQQQQQQASAGSASAAASSTQSPALRVLAPVPHVLCLPPSYTRHASFAKLPLTSRMLAPLVTTGQVMTGATLLPTKTDVRVILPAGHADTMLYISVFPDGALHDPAVARVDLARSMKPQQPAQQLHEQESIAARTHALSTTCWRVARALCAEMAADILLDQAMQMRDSDLVIDDGEGEGEGEGGTATASVVGKKRKREEEHDSHDAAISALASALEAERMRGKGAVIGRVDDVYADDQAITIHMQATKGAKGFALRIEARRHDNEGQALEDRASRSCAWALPVAQSVAAHLGSAVSGGPLGDTNCLRQLLRSACTTA